MIASKLDFGSVPFSLSLYAVPFPILCSTFPYSVLSYWSTSFFSCLHSHLTLFPLHKHAEFYNVLFFSVTLYKSYTKIQL